VASLLVQQLISHFSNTFLISAKSAVEQVALGEHGTAGKLPRGASLRDFLCEEVTLLLLTSIYLISNKVKEGKVWMNLVGSGGQTGEWRDVFWFCAKRVVIFLLSDLDN